MKNMRSIGMLVAGVVIGIGISFAPDLYAASSKLLGSKVGNVLNVKIDNKSIGEGAVIGGTTYIPLRTAATEMGLEVKSVNSKEVTLESQDTPTDQPVSPPTEGNTEPSTGADVTDTTTDSVSAKKDELNSKIGNLKIKIKEAQEIIKNKPALERAMQTDQDMIDLMTRMKENGSPEFDELRLRQAQESKARTEKNLVDAEANLPVWEKELTDLEAQLSELQK